MSIEAFRTYLRQNLNEPQYTAVTHVQGPLLILAGAGSGKTRCVTYRAAYMLAQGIRPESILCVTFTNKAADEMKTRIAGLVGTGVAAKIQISTFHSFCVKVLMREGDALGLQKKFNIYNTHEQRRVITEVCNDHGIDEHDLPIENIMREISQSKNDMIGPDNYQRDDVLGKAAKVIYKGYQEYLRHFGAVDFDDLLYYCADLFLHHPASLQKLQKKFSYIMIDEFQDTNAAQYTIARLLAGRIMNIAVVGDDDQSIYGWRGADIKNILNFEKDFPNTKVVKLEENYRSTSIILDAANAVIRNNAERKSKALWSELGEGDKIRTIGAEDPVDEAQKIADDIGLLSLQHGIPLKDFAVLYRTNAQGNYLEEVFRKSNIAFHTSNKRDFYDRQEIRYMLSYLKLLHNTNDDLSLLHIIGFPRRNIGTQTMRKVKDLAILKKLSFFEALEVTGQSGATREATQKEIAHFVEIIKNYGKLMQGKEFPDFLKEFFFNIEFTAEIDREKCDDHIKELRKGNVTRLLNQIEQYAKKAKRPSLGEYLIKLALFFSGNTDEEETEDFKEDAVNFLTIHAAKGLEFPYVYIIGVEENMLPFVRDEESACNPAEERRLCYVAMTRAQRSLTMSVCRWRKRNQETIECAPSRFLAEIPDALILRNYGGRNDGDPEKVINKDEIAELTFQKLKDILNK